MDYFKKVSAIVEIAKENKFSLLQHQENIKLLIFGNNVAKINVYYSKMTVGTCLNHPTKGKTQLFRKNVSMKVLRKIFQNPRVHTGYGYYQKNGGSPKKRKPETKQEKNKRSLWSKFISFFTS